MADKLMVWEVPLSYGEGYIIAWYLEDDQDMGAVLGEEIHSLEVLDRELTKALKDRNDDEALHASANKTLLRLVGAVPDGHPESPIRHTGCGYVFATRKAANEALRLIKGEFKACQAGQPWPDWARQAFAAGWKPPKGWKP